MLICVKNTSESVQCSAYFAIYFFFLITQACSFESGSRELHRSLLLSKTTLKIKAWPSENVPLNVESVKKRKSHFRKGTFWLSITENVSLKGQTHLSAFCSPICSILMTDRYQCTAEAGWCLSAVDTGRLVTSGLD